MIHEGAKKKSSDTVPKVAKQKSRQRHSRAPRWVSGTSTDKREEKRAHPAQQQDGEITSSCQALRSWTTKRNSKRRLELERREPTVSTKPYYLVLLSLLPRRLFM